MHNYCFFNFNFFGNTFGLSFINFDLNFCQHIESINAHQICIDSWQQTNLCFCVCWKETNLIFLDTLIQGRNYDLMFVQGFSKNFFANFSANRTNSFFGLTQNSLRLKRQKVWFSIWNLLRLRSWSTPRLAATNLTGNFKKLLKTGF